VAVEDWDINIAVRQELVKRWVDLRRVLFNTIGGIVHIKGVIVFTKTKGGEEKIVASIEERLETEKKRLSDLERRLKKIKGVKGVVFNLTDWVKAGTEWKRKV